MICAKRYSEAEHYARQLFQILDANHRESIDPDRADAEELLLPPLAAKSATPKPPPFDLAEQAYLASGPGFKIAADHVADLRALLPPKVAFSLNSSNCINLTAESRAQLKSSHRQGGQNNPPTPRRAAALCLARTHYEVAIEHFLLKLVEAQDNDFPSIATHFGVDVGRLTVHLNRAVDNLKTGNASTPSFSLLLEAALSSAWLYASLDSNAPEIRSGFVLLALLTDERLTRRVLDYSDELRRIDANVLNTKFSEITLNSPERTSPQAPTTRPQETRGPRLFISYRRDDASMHVDFLYSTLVAEVPGLSIFRDLDTLQPGMLFVDKINEALASADFLLAVISKKWLGAKPKTAVRRIDLPDDFVRLEVAAAFEKKKIVIPCLIDGAKMPRKEDLPVDVQGLVTRHAITLSNSSLRRDSRVLVDMLKAWRRPAP